MTSDARTSAANQDLDLDRRSGWPNELCLLREALPRNSWSSHHNFALARFWLERHESFRQHAAALQHATAEQLEGRVSADEFQRWLGPSLQGFLAALHGHHQIEDQHYFPSFRAADRRLASGFDVLDRDHRLIHESIAGVIKAGNKVLQAREAATLRRTVEEYAVVGEQLRERLIRHLEDEEDLVIPLMLERGA